MRRLRLSRPEAPDDHASACATGPESRTQNLMLGALGVVFGDIGTSPLYTMKHLHGRDRRCHPCRGHGSALADRLGADHRGDVEIRDRHDARRQPRRGRHPRADGAGAARRQTRGPAGGAGAGGRHGRRRALLRRRRHHAGDLGALGGRGPEGHRARPSSDCVIPLTVAAAARPLRRAAARHRRRRRATSARSRPSGSLPCRSPGSIEIILQPEILEALNPYWGVASAAEPPLEGLRAAGRGGAGGDRGRGALCRYGTFRAQGDQSRLALSRLSRPAAELFRPGRPSAGRSQRRGQSLLSPVPDLGALSPW